ncbi:hypothetical protein C8F04DRAFT_1193658 [Mycena alexandri]|uniref:Uncharacterized protein n=1 Tax=Mycena alexandri TaxID=1745969 RepID=A0AAD6WTR6_9AGAR|nr:hypothetical protein C8F04DRAFT_1193658 [Mycena alexandri]
MSAVAKLNRSTYRRVLSKMPFLAGKSVILERRLEANLQSQFDAAFAPGLTEGFEGSGTRIRTKSQEYFQSPWHSSWHLMRGLSFPGPGIGDNHAVTVTPLLPHHDAPFLIAFLSSAGHTFMAFQCPFASPTFHKSSTMPYGDLKRLRRDALEPTEEFSLVEDQPDATQGTIATHWSLGISAQGCRIGFHAESLHPGHHSIAKEAVQCPLTFSFDGNCVAGIADPVQCLITFSFSGNVEQVGGIASHAKSLRPGHHSIAPAPVQYPLMFSFDGNVERVGSIVCTQFLVNEIAINPSGDFPRFEFAAATRFGYLYPR